MDKKKGLKRQKKEKIDQWNTQEGDIISKNEQALNKLKSLVDLDTYIKMSVMLAGETIYFPAAGTPKDKQERNRAICQAYYNGVGVPELVEIYGLSERQIWRIIGRRAV